jgi:SAM-dependent methyltransferase
MAYASGLPTPEEFSSYYTGMSKYESAISSYASSPEDQARCETIVDMVDAAVSDRAIAVLDIGCSTGALLAAFKQRGYADPEGLDPSPACATIAWETHGILVHTGTAADVATLPRRYGLVTLSAVLEHLLDPLQTLRGVRQVLDDDGLLFIEVPDVEGFSACARAPFQEFSVEHINYFSTASLTSLLGAIGFTRVVLERRRIPWRSDSLMPVVHAVFRKAPVAAPIARDAVSEAALLAYVEASEDIEAQVRRRIQDLTDTRRPVLVWGVGTHTRHLLRSGALDGLRIAAWVDSDPKLQGKQMRGLSIIAPESVKQRPEPILVSSGTVHHEIARQIREDLRVDNEVVLLYE